MLAELSELLPVAGWEVPSEVGIEGSELVCRPGHGGRQVHPAPEQLHRFAGLAGAPDERIADFARAQGVLGLCPRHGLPRGHPALFNRPRTTFSGLRLVQMPVLPDPGATYTLSNCGWPEDPDARVREQLADWRRYAAGAGAVRLLWDARSQRDHPGGPFHEPSLWAALLDARVLARPPVLPVDRSGKFPIPRPSEALPELRRMVSDWLLAANVPILLDPDTGGFVFAATTLFGGLALQLALALSRGEVPLPCGEPGCPLPALPRRRGGPAFCEEHIVTGAAARARQRRFHNAHPGYYSKAAKAERAARRG